MNTFSLTEITEIWGQSRGELKIGLQIPSSPASNQLITILEKLTRYKHLTAVALTPLSEWNENKAWYRQQPESLRLVKYGPDEHVLLNVFDLVIFPESNQDSYAEFPPSVIKIGLPHGVDIPLEKTVDTYGGGYCFDYVLSAKHQSVMFAGRFLDRFAPELRSHSRPYLCEIPFGFPKLDEFLNEVTEQAGKQPKAIVYHLSYLAIEAPWAISLIKPTLQRLLNAFPDYRIVFRPYHLDREHPVVKDCQISGKDYNNFYFSDADSYISDYAPAMAMVCHRSYKLHLFGLATGRKTFLCHPDTEKVSVYDPLFTSCTDKELIEKLQKYLSQTGEISLHKRQAHCREMGIHNPGSSIDYLVEHLNDLLHDKVHDGWTYYALDSDHPPPLRTQIALQLMSARHASMGLVALAHKNSDNPASLLFVADSYARCNNLQLYYYTIALRYFHRLLTQNDFSAQLTAAMDFWWGTCGSHVLDYVVKESQRDNVPLPPEACALMEYSPGQTDVPIWPNNQLPLINLSTLQAVQDGGPLAIYGAGEITRRLITQGLAEIFDIQLLVDSDKNKHGSQLSGHTIYSPEVLSAWTDPVLISSSHFLHEIYHRLRQQLGQKNLLYGVLPDERIQRLVELI